MKKIILSTLNLLNQEISLLVGRLEKNGDSAFEGRRELDPVKNINGLIALGVKVISPGSLTGVKLGDKISPSDIKKMLLSIPILDSKFEGVVLYKNILFSDIVFAYCLSNADKSHDSLCVNASQKLMENTPAGIVENFIELLAYAHGSRYILEK